MSEKSLRGLATKLRTSATGNEEDNNRLPIHQFRAGDPVQIDIQVSKSKKHLQYNGRYGVVDNVILRSGVDVRFDSSTTKLFFPNDVRVLTEEEVKANSKAVNVARRAWENRYGR